VTVPRATRPLALAALAVATACAHGRQPDDELPAGPTTIIFTNQSQDQADVFAVPSGGGTMRIGTVFPGRTDTLTLPRGSVSAGTRVNFVARLLARSMAPSSGLVSIQPGDWLSITLPPSANVLSVLPAP
jgi:hypothetical protein